MFMQGSLGTDQVLRGTLAAILALVVPRQTCEASGEMVLSFILIQNRQYVTVPGTTAPTLHEHTWLTIRD
jgi:hypothetical protein